MSMLLFHVIIILLGLKKALRTAAKNDATSGILNEWSASIVNHLYWAAASTEKGPDCADIIEAKWRSLLNHICGKHTHSFEHYPKCTHERRRRHQKKKKYMKKGKFF